VFLTALTL